MNILEKTIHKNLIKHINKDKNIKNISNIFEKDNRYIFVDSNHGGKTLNDAVSNEIIKESNFLSKHCNNKI